MKDHKNNAKFPEIPKINFPKSTPGPSYSESPRLAVHFAPVLIEIRSLGGRFVAIFRSIVIY